MREGRRPDVINERIKIIRMHDCGQGEWHSDTMLAEHAHEAIVRVDDSGFLGQFELGDASVNVAQQRLQWKDADGASLIITAVILLADRLDAESMLTLPLRAVEGLVRLAVQMFEGLCVAAEADADACSQTHNAILSKREL